MKKKQVLILVLLMLNVITQGQRPITFPSEYIDFSLDENYFTIDGIYTFRNRTDKLINHDIIFPFCIQTKQIDTISVVDLRNFLQLPIRKMENYIVFNLTVAPLDSTQIHIFYRQKTTKRNCYILTTTQSWEEPLVHAVYTLTINTTLPVDSFSFPPDSSCMIDGRLTFFWQKSDFMPQTDFEILLAD